MSKVIPCREAETRLPDYLNDTLEYTAGIEVSRHLARCPACWAKARGTMARALIQSEPQRAHQQRWGYLWSQIREAVQDPASPVASLRQAITTRWAAWADLSPSPVGAYQPAMAFAAPAGATAGSFRRSLSAREQERSRQERAAETPLYDVESVSEDGAPLGDSLRAHLAGPARVNENGELSLALVGEGTPPTGLCTCLVRLDEEHALRFATPFEPSGSGWRAEFSVPDLPSPAFPVRIPPEALQFHRFPAGADHPRARV